MGERKVLSKYYPPDFDPSKIKRLRLGRDRQYTVRLMAPFNMRCINCGNYIYKGTKFNATKETVENEDYLGLHVFRFYIRCTRCCNEITFKTDPKNTDYTCEMGATRNFESWRMKDRIGTIDDEIAAQEAEEAEVNPMKALEQRTKESRQEMDILDALEEIKDANARSAKVEVEDVLANKAKTVEALREVAVAKQREEEDAAVAAAFGGVGKRVRRLADLPEDGSGGAAAAAVTPAPSGADIFGGSDQAASKRAKNVSTGVPSVGSLRTDRLGLVRRKPAEGGKGNARAATSSSTSAAKAAPAPPAALAGLADYGSDSE